MIMYVKLVKYIPFTLGIFYIISLISWSYPLWLGYNKIEILGERRPEGDPCSPSSTKTTTTTE